MKIWKKIFAMVIGSAVMVTVVGCGSNLMSTHEKAERADSARSALYGDRRLGGGRRRISRLSAAGRACGNGIRPGQRA